MAIVPSNYILLCMLKLVVRNVGCMASSQTNGMLLLTANRKAKGEDSLDRVMREENTPTSLPIITICERTRVSEYEYRDACVERLVEIVIDLEDYLGVGRLFIP